MRLLALALAVTVLPGAVAAKPASLAWPTGLYSNVRMSEETGDLGGFEVRFYDEAGRHMAEFVYCEGWCNETHVSEVVREGDGFILGYTEIFTGAEGDVPVKMRFVLRPVGSALAYSVYQGNEIIDYNGKPRRMRRAAKVFGIAVAKSGKD